MKAQPPGFTPQRILDTLKKGASIMYPNLILPHQAPADGAVGDSESPGGGAPLSWQDFPILKRMRASLNSIWGNLVIKDNEPKNGIAFYGCSNNVGATFLSFHLAVFVALGQGTKIIYVDTDCNKRPDAPHPIGATDLRGLNAFYFEDAPIESCIHPTRVPNFYILPTGLLAAGLQKNHFPPVQKIRQLTEALHKQFDVAIYDCQPVLTNPIEITFGQLVQHILLISRYAVSRREVCSQAVETFKANGLDLAGVVLNQREYPIPMKLYNLLK